MIKGLFLLVFSLTFSLCYAQDKIDHYKRANAYYDNKEYAEALVEINKAMRGDSVNADYYLLKGNIYDKLEQYQRAFDAYTLGIDRDSSDPVLYNQRGLLLMKVRETELAIRDFTQAMKVCSSDTMKVVLLVNRGAASIEIRKFTDAYDDFYSAYQLDSLDIGTLNNLAAVCDEIGKGDMTLVYLNKVLSIDSTIVGAYVNIGFRYQKLEEHSLAIEYFNKVIELSAEEPLAYSNRAYSKYKMGNLESALSDINKSITLWPGNSYAFRNRALIYLSMKRNVAACEDLEEAIRLGFVKRYGDEVMELKKAHCP